MNQQALLKKARQLQQEMMNTQKEIEESEFKASAGGVVTVLLKGTKELAEIEISKDFAIESEEDLQMLTEMIVVACHQAYKDIEKTTEEKMGKYQAFLGGMGSLF